MIKDITLQEFEQLNKKGVVIVDFYTEWCGNCKMMEPVFKSLHDKYGKEVTFVTINAENANVFRQEGKYNVLKVPTFIVYKDGIETDRGVEYNPIQKMEEWLNKALKI